MKPIFWSASRLDKIETCKKAYWYQYVSKEKFSSIGVMAAGILLHKKAENFYKKDGTPKFKSAESFANASMATWQRFNINTGTVRGQEIKWKDETEPYKLKYMIGEVCKVLYEKYSNDEPPLFTEYPFKFHLEDRLYTGFIDEIRKGLVIRDHKSGYGRPNDSKENPDVKLHTNHQFTIYALALTSIAKRDENFRKQIGMTEKQLEKAKKSFILEDIVVEYHHMLTGETFQSKRTDTNYRELTNAIDRSVKTISDGDFSVRRGNHCNYCLHNLACYRDTIQEERPKINEEIIQASLFDGKNTKKPEIEQIKIKFPRKKLILFKN
jgi:hypothetical protein